MRRRAFLFLSILPNGRTDEGCCPTLAHRRPRPSKVAKKKKKKKTPCILRPRCRTRPLRHAWMAVIHFMQPANADPPTRVTKRCLPQPQPGKRRRPRASTHHRPPPSFWYAMAAATPTTGSALGQTLPLRVPAMCPALPNVPFPAASPSVADGLASR
ncbi:uncharacterized protein IWZ02DRAFT_235178 [Phyllosticta citriasiana]|uniref:uncharacterized protein n=1 Tax=Phyllosticta citriasiana TaxID=595635 RepID=UPI0030FD675C